MPKWITALCVALLVAAGVGPLARPALADDEQVDLLLVLAADVSRSVDEKKFKLQRDGYAAAIVDPRVVRAMTAGPTGRIALCFLEWASDGEQIVVIDWTPVGSEAEAQGRLQAHSRGAARLHGPHLDQRRHRLLHGACWRAARLPAPRRVIDVSGDGTNNSGRPVTLARDAAIAAGRDHQRPRDPERGAAADQPACTRIRPGGLTAYYENNVIGGPGAFVVEAENFEAFGQLLISKLIKEIAVAPGIRRADKGALRARNRPIRSGRHGCSRSCGNRLDRISRWRFARSRFGADERGQMVAVRAARCHARQEGAVHIDTNEALSIEHDERDGIAIADRVWSGRREWHRARPL